MKEAEIAQLLPEVFQRTVGPRSVLRSALAAMEQLHGPAEEILAQIDSIPDPHRTPDAFVAFLARWVDLERIFTEAAARAPDAIEVPISTGLGRLRQLIQMAARLSRWRGTAFGLRSFLETATGVTGFEIEEEVVEEGKVKPFHIRVRAPKTVEEHRPLIEKIIEVERPAYVTWELVFDG
ncbi:MAG: hypothetical protein KIT09_23635 [Bryobacteraceae bacterium]|nr:hypothetical protein [Bryobacteraceae bacterium]